MKKYFRLSVVALFISAGMLATQGLSAQKRVIKVQGHPHEYLTKLHGGKEDVKATVVASSTDTIDFNAIQCWAGTVDPSRPSARAVLVVKWTDERALQRGDSILVWGYRWNTKDASGFDVHKYTIDMIRAVGNTDCNFIALLQNTGGGNFTVGGIGYSFDDFQTPPNIIFKPAEAAGDARVKFNYTGSPNCDMAQLGIPYNVGTQVVNAINKATGNPPSPSLSKTGIIDHPFNADYGYPAYDYDHWTDDDDPGDGYEWQSGWYDGYWTFFQKETPTGTFVSSDTLSIVSRELHDGAVDGFVFNPEPLVWPPIANMSGSYRNGMDCSCDCSSGSATKKWK
jgi:hypothetical protein